MTSHSEPSSDIVGRTPTGRQSALWINAASFCCRRPTGQPIQLPYRTSREGSRVFGTPVPRRSDFVGAERQCPHSPFDRLGARDRAGPCVAPARRAASGARRGGSKSWACLRAETAPGCMASAIVLPAPKLKHRGAWTGCRTGTLIRIFRQIGDHIGAVLRRRQPGKCHLGPGNLRLRILEIDEQFLLGPGDPGFLVGF